MAKISIFFDTNVLVYAHDEISPFHKQSAALLKKVLSGDIKGTLSEQNLIEIYRVFTSAHAMRNKPLLPERVVTLIQDTYLSSPMQIVFPSLQSLTMALHWAQIHQIQSARIFDFRLYAQAILSGADYFVTYNVHDFKNLGNLAVILPEDLPL